MGLKPSVIYKIKQKPQTRHKQIKHIQIESYIHKTICILKHT